MFKIGFTGQQVSHAMSILADASAEAARLDPLTTARMEAMAVKPWWAPTEWWRARVFAALSLEAPA